MPVTCPYGSEMKPATDTFVSLATVWTEMSSYLVDLIPFLGWINDTLNIVIFDMDDLCKKGPYDYPTVLDVDWTSEDSAMRAVLAYAKPFLWDKFCRCKTLPGG